MIQYIEGDIFSSPAQVIVNTVNTVGVMGKGVALSFKKRYPDMFQHYKSICEKRLLTIGKLMLYYEPDYWVLLFPTKENWRNPSKLEYIEKGLMKFVNTYAEKSITSIAFPRLGCGNGGLDWEDVRPLMEKYLNPLPIDVYVYLGMINAGTPEYKDVNNTLDWLKKNAKDMSFVGLKDDIKCHCGLISYSFDYHGKSIDIRYEDGVLFENGGKQKAFITEDVLYQIWDRLRTQSIVSESECEGENLILSLLNSLGYLSFIRIYNSKTNTFKNGFQINEGAGRVFDIEGVQQ